MKTKIETLQLYINSLANIYTVEEIRKLVEEFKLKLGL
jgi:hypothetical protein